MLITTTPAHYSLRITTLSIAISSWSLNAITHISASNNLSSQASADFAKKVVEGWWRVGGRLVEG